MKGKFVGLTGSAGSGKDTLAKHLSERIRENSNTFLISGSAVFRAAALWACEQMYDPSKPLPSKVFDSVKLRFHDGYTVKITQGGESKTYTPTDYATFEVGKAGSDFAKTSAEVYKSFIFREIQEQIREKSNEGIHSILGARDSFRIAGQIPDISALLVYLAVSDQVQRRRLSNRLESSDELERERYVQKELDRDQQDVTSGTLPSVNNSYLPLDRNSQVKSGLIYQLDTNLLDIDEATEILYSAFIQIVGP